MRPLKVAVFVKDSPGARITGDKRNMGFWSYDVPEFTWKFFPHNHKLEDLGKFRDYDFIFHEDSGYATYLNKQHGPPVVYLDIESCFSIDHYNARMKQAVQSDLVLVDWDPLNRFHPSGKKVIRFPYCVNDRQFYPRQKDNDVVWHAATSKLGGEIRKDLTRELIRLSKLHGFTLRHGPRDLVDYADSMGRSRIGANRNRTSIIRAHRTFDTMASGAALITGPTPFTEGDGAIDGEHYLTFRDNAELEAAIMRLLSGEWIEFAERGYKLISENHTWAIRAAQLREIVAGEFGI